MKLIAANQVSEQALEHFLQTNKDIHKSSLLEKGYVVEIGDKIEGCFVLDTVEIDSYWLKQLYITKQNAAVLPALLESILVIAKEKQAKKVFVHSHQPMIDILLDALQFYPQKESVVAGQQPPRKGKWWSYQVS